MTTGEELRDAGIEQVEGNANQEWMTTIVDYIIPSLRAGVRFTSDDVWNLLAEWDVTTYNHSAMGAALKRSQRQGLCMPTGEYRASTRKEAHCRPIHVWLRTA